MLFLIGPRASGKTSVANLLASLAPYHAYDLDHLFQEKAGCTIADFVQKSGWEAFRSEEGRLLAAVAQRYRGRSDVVVATGGGVVLDPSNRACLVQSGAVVYLHAPPELLIARLTKDPRAHERPALLHVSLAEEVREIAAKRTPLYRACASLELNAALPLPELARILLERFPPTNGREVRNG